MSTEVDGRYLVIGLGVSGEALAQALVARGAGVVVVEDAPNQRSRARAARLSDIEVHESPSPRQLQSLVAEAGVVVPSPGVPLRHPAVALARAQNLPVMSELELAARWARCPLVAVTGTNGKTTVTTLITEMLSASGLRAEAAGNIGLPLACAVSHHLDVIVVEVSSFQLALTAEFHPSVAVWLNVAEDHLDWHPTFEDYVGAKARIWARQEGDDVAVVNAEDPVIMAAAARAPARVVSFGVDEPDGGRRADWHVAGGALHAPDGEVVVALSALPRVLPHELANALAASAAATAAGASLDAVGATLSSLRSLPHRVTLVCDAGGVRWYDDSKATNPHAVIAALRGFESVVLIAGGRNKGLDLTPMTGVGERVRAVVAIGDAASEVEAAFAGRAPTTMAASMDEAVAAAARFARPGDSVVSTLR